MDYIGFAAIAGCYLAIIGLYVWVFRQIAEVKKEMNKHQQKFDVHTSSDKLVFKDVCDQKVMRIEGKVDDLKETIKTGFAEITKFIKHNGNTN